MHTHNEILIRAPLEPCFRAAADVERWPEILSHYRRVRFLRRDGFGEGRVEMAAYRRFGPLPWPVWWASEMTADPDRGTIRYHHVDGITRGMDVLWRLEPAAEGGRPPPGATGRDGDEHGAGPDPAEPGTGRGDAAAAAPATRAVVLHDWEGPPWPLVGRFAAERVIGPWFVRVVAERTLRGIRSEVEGR